MAEEQGLEVSIDGFNKCMNQQRERSRVSSKQQCQVQSQIVRCTVLQHAMDSPGSSTLHLALCMASQLCETIAKQSSKRSASKQGCNTSDALLSIDSSPEIVKAACQKAGMCVTG